MELNADEKSIILKINALKKARVVEALPSLIFLAKESRGKYFFPDIITAIADFGDEALPLLKTLLENSKDNSFIDIIILILSQIDTIKATKLLCNLYNVSEDFNYHISCEIGRKLGNKFIENELLELTDEELPNTLKALEIDKESWYYKTHKNASEAFLKLDQQIRSDLCKILKDAHEKYSNNELNRLGNIFQEFKLHRISFKILFPTIISLIKDSGSQKTSISTFCFTQFNFDQKKIDDWIYNSNLIFENPNFSVNYVLNRSILFNQEDNKTEKNQRKILRLLLSMSFLCYLLFNSIGLMDFTHFVKNESRLLSNAYAWSFPPETINEIIKLQDKIKSYDIRFNQYENIRTKQFSNVHNSHDIDSLRTFIKFIDTTYLLLSSELIEEKYNNDLAYFYAVIDAEIQTIKSLEENLDSIKNLNVDYNFLKKRWKALDNLVLEYEELNDECKTSILKGKTIGCENIILLKNKFDSLKLISKNSLFMKMINNLPYEITSKFMDNDFDLRYGWFPLSDETIDADKYDESWYDVMIPRFMSNSTLNTRIDSLLSIFSDIQQLERSLNLIINRKSYVLNLINRDLDSLNSIEGKWVKKNISLNLDHILISTQSRYDSLLIANESKPHNLKNNLTFDIPKSVQYPNMLIEAKKLSRKNKIYSKIDIYQNKTYIYIISVSFIVFIMCLWGGLIYKFRRGLTVSRLFKILLNPISYFLDLLPYSGRNAPSMNYLLFSFIIIICSPLSFLIIKLINEHLDIFILSYIYFSFLLILLIGALYLIKIQKEDPIYNLLILHPKGRSNLRDIK